MLTRKQALKEAFWSLRYPICKCFFWGIGFFSLVISSLPYPSTPQYSSIPFNLFDWLRLLLVPWLGTTIFMALLAMSLTYSEKRTKVPSNSTP
mgnify:FL=1